MGTLCSALRLQHLLYSDLALFDSRLSEPLALCLQLRHCSLSMLPVQGLVRLTSPTRGLEPFRGPVVCAVSHGGFPLTGVPELPGHPELARSQQLHFA